MAAIANAFNAVAMKILKVGGCKEVNLQDQIVGNTALHIAIGKGYKKESAHGQQLKYSNAELAKVLVENGADINLVNKAGNTPIHLAFLHRDLEMISYLIAKGARLDIKNNNNQSPLDMLNLNYQQAYDILKGTVFIFLLDETVFKDNLEIIKQYLIDQAIIK